MLIVDGNNVSSPRRPWHRVLWGAQLRLAVDVARLTHDWESCADVVFNGSPRPPLRSGGVVNGVQVWFSGARSADDRIVELVREDLGRDDRTIVATSDRGLARRVRSLGAQTVSSDNLRRALDWAGSGAPLRRMPLIPGTPMLLALLAPLTPHTRVEKAHPGNRRAAVGS